MIRRIDINGINGTPMRVILVPTGEHSPNCAMSSTKDTGEFYDGRYDHTPDGQFISSYNVSTLVKYPLLTSREAPSNGLDLFGDQSDWKVDAPTMQMVMDWLRYHTGRL